MFAGTRALHTKSCVALLDTGSPASFIRKKVWNDMLGSGAALSDGEVPTQSRRWGGFHGKPLTTSTSVRLRVLLGRKGIICGESTEDTPVQTVVWAQIIPDRVMSYDLLLGRDSWDHFPVRKYRDTNEDETVVAFTAQDEGSVDGDHRFKKRVDQAIGMIESPADCKVVVMYADKSCMLSEGFTWAKVELSCCDESAADLGSHYVLFQDGWIPKEAIVDAGLSENHLHWTEGSEHHLRSQTTLGYASTWLRRVNLVNATTVIPQDSTSLQQATLTKDKKTSVTTPMAKKNKLDKGRPQPPQNVMTQLDPQPKNLSADCGRVYEKISR